MNEKIMELREQYPDAKLQKQPMRKPYEEMVVDIEPYYNEEDDTIYRYEVVEIDEETKQEHIKNFSRQLRDKRNKKLKEADILSLKYLERGEAVPQEILDYKQELRDLTAQEDFPKTFKFPIQPKL